MSTNKGLLPSSNSSFWISLGGVGVGIAAGVLAGAKPLFLGLVLGAVIALVYFFADFERAVLGLLILRSSLDNFSAQQIPAVFAIGLDVLTLLYVCFLLLTGQTVRTDKFWWFFVGWVMLQGLWVILLPLGGLGLDASVLPDGIREWMRLFSWLMVYLLVMQLKDKLSPEKIVSVLFLSLLIPCIVATMQMFLPALLPPILSGTEIASLNSLSLEGASRIRGTLGHSNTFATFIFLFIGLTWWKLEQAKNRVPWLLLLGVLTFFYVSTKALFSLMMLGIFVLVLVVPKMSLPKLIGGVLLLILVIGLFTSTEFGQERLASIANTPLFNEDIDISRAVLLSTKDYNSFNWRLAQWTFLLQAWQQHPILGYGLLTSPKLTVLHNYAHSEYVRALVEGGIIGLVTFLFFFLVQIGRLVRLFCRAPLGSAQRSLCLILLAMLLAMMIGMITENIWNHTVLFFYWVTLSAIAGWNWSKSQVIRSY